MKNKVVSGYGETYERLTKRSAERVFNGVGEVISHATDWWENGSGDVLFIRAEYVSPFEKWSKE